VQRRIGPSSPEVPVNKPAETAKVADCLHLEGDLVPADLDRIIDHWEKLDHRLQSFPAGSVGLHLSLKERDTSSQKATLEARLPGHTHLVATAHHEDLDRCLNMVRDEMIRQITDWKTKHEPRNNRHLREDIRH
jgi:ribosome-associated translation inhibitor RaiA